MPQDTSGTGPCATLGRMKRDEALRPLSREHLEALLAAKKLREAESLEEAGDAFLSRLGSTIEQAESA